MIPMRFQMEPLTFWVGLQNFISSKSIFTVFEGSMMSVSVSLFGMYLIIFIMGAKDVSLGWFDSSFLKSEIQFFL